MKFPAVGTGFCSFFLLLITHSLLLLCAYGKTEEEIIYELPSYSFKDLEVYSPATVMDITNSLVTVGAVQISNIPFYQRARLNALDPLANCLEEERQSHLDNQLMSMTMEDGSYRLSIGTKTRDTSPVPLHDKQCVQPIESLRFVIDNAMKQLFLVLDAASASIHQTTGQSAGPLMAPYNTFHDLIEAGEHLEHLHVYYPPAEKTLGKKSETSGTEIDTSDVQVPVTDTPPSTMRLHLDVGLMIAMTAGHYSVRGSNAAGSNDKDKVSHLEDSYGSGGGLYVQLVNGAVAKAQASPDSLIVLMGEGAAKWLKGAEYLGAPIRAVPHELKAEWRTTSQSKESKDEEEEKESASQTITRSWYGKMYQPPADALIPGSGSTDLTFSKLKELLRINKREEEERSILLPTGCGETHTTGLSETKDSLLDPVSVSRISVPITRGEYSARGSDLESMLRRKLQTPDECNADPMSVYCWTMCMPLDNACLPGYVGECVDDQGQVHNDPNEHCTDVNCAPRCMKDDGMMNMGNMTSNGFCYGNGVSMSMEGFVKSAPGFLGFGGSTDGASDYSNECVNLLFTEWTLDTSWKFFVACLGTFIVAVFFHALIRFRFILKKIEHGDKDEMKKLGTLFGLLRTHESRPGQELLSPDSRTGEHGSAHSSNSVASNSSNWSRAQCVFTLSLLAYGSQIVLSYFLMLIAMTYSIELFTSLCLGLLLGQAVFNMDSPAVASVEPCCLDIDEGVGTLDSKESASYASSGPLLIRSSSLTVGTGGKDEEDRGSYSPLKGCSEHGHGHGHGS